MTLYLKKQGEKGKGLKSRNFQKEAALSREDIERSAGITVGK